MYNSMKISITSTKDVKVSRNIKSTSVLAIKDDIQKCMDIKSNVIHEIKDAIEMLRSVVKASHITMYIDDLFESDSEINTNKVTIDTYYPSVIEVESYTPDAIITKRILLEYLNVESLYEMLTMLKSLLIKKTKMDGEQLLFNFKY